MSDLLQYMNITRMLVNCTEQVTHETKQQWSAQCCQWDFQIKSKITTSNLVELPAYSRTCGWSSLMALKWASGGGLWRMEWVSLTQSTNTPLTKDKRLWKLLVPVQLGELRKGKERKGKRVHCCDPRLIGRTHCKLGNFVGMVRRWNERHR